MFRPHSCECRHLVKEVFVGRNNVRSLVPARLRHVEKLAHETFDMPLAKHGLIGQHQFIDNTNYFIIPKAGGLELLWFYDLVDQTPRAVLEAGIDGKSFSRLTWVSGKSWNYSMMGLEDERRICERGVQFLQAINMLLATDYAVGIEYPVKEDRLADIVEFHAQAFLIAKGPR